MSATATVDIGDLIESRPGVSGGQPCLRGTGVTVARVAHLAHAEGLVAAEIVERLGGGLQLAAIHAALAYYYSNRDALDAETLALLARHDELADLAEASSLARLVR